MAAENTAVQVYRFPTDFILGDCLSEISINMPNEDELFSVFLISRRQKRQFQISCTLIKNLQGTVQMTSVVISLRLSMPFLFLTTLPHLSGVRQQLR